jgi:hypothetical protein
VELSNKEKSLMNRIAGQKNMYLIFSIISVAVAVILLVYYFLIAKNINSLRFVVIILILMAGRTHLRQYRSALLIHKFKGWFENNENTYETDTK